MQVENLADFDFSTVKLGFFSAGASVSDIDAILAEDGRTPEAQRDAISTRLMDSFRQTRGRGAFGLLYELNGQHLLTQVVGRLRRYTSMATSADQGAVLRV